MSLAFVSSTGGTYAENVASFTFSHTPSGAHDLVVVPISVLTLADPVTFSGTYDGNAMNVAYSITQNNVYNLRSAVLWYPAPPSGTKTVVVNVSGGNMWGMCGCDSFLGADQTAPIGTPTAQNQTLASSDTIAFSSTAGRIICDTVISPTSPFVWSGNQTLDWNSGGPGGVSFPCASQHASSTGGAVNMTWTAGGNVQLYHAAFEIIAASASFKPAWATGATKVIGGAF